MDETLTRIEKLEVSMREHTHLGIDSTTPLAPTASYIQYFTNEPIITPRMGATGVEVYVDITAIAQAFTIANQAGTPVNFQKLVIRIKDDGTGRAITWGSNYVAGGYALPTTTIAGKILTLGFFYNTANGLNKFQLVAGAQEA